MFLLCASIVLFLVWLSLRTWHMIKICRSLKEIMYPCIPLPIIGQVYKIIARTDYIDIFNLITEEAMNNKHGVCAVWFGSKLCVFVADAEVASSVCNLPTCLDKGELYKIIKSVVGQGSLFAPAKFWRRRRKILMPGFSAVRLNSLFQQVFIPHAENIVKTLKPMVGKEHFNIRQYVDTYNISVVYETVLGKTLEQDEKSGQQFLNSFDVSVKIIADRLMKPWLHNDIIYQHLPIYKTLMHHINIIWDIIVKRIDEVRKELKLKNVDADTLKASESRFQAFIKTLIDNSGGDNGYTDSELREELFVLLFAAIDTSAIGMSFVCLLLARYPEVQEKVHNELDDILKNSTRSLTLEDLPRLQYLEAVIKEVLRLYPPAPLISRNNVEAVTLPTGIVLPKNTDIIFSTNGINRNTRYWGADATEFKPERWLTGEKTHPAAFMSFSHGVRNCPGYKYAMMSIKSVLSAMLRRYRIVPEESKDLKVYFNIMIAPVDGYQIRIEEK